MRRSSGFAENEPPRDAPRWRQCSKPKPPQFLVRQSDQAKPYLASGLDAAAGQRNEWTTFSGTGTYVDACILLFTFGNGSD